MSYCRANGQDSDVYVIATTSSSSEKTVWWCCGCKREGCAVDNRQEMIGHLERHVAEGDKVPERAFERLRREIREIDAG